MIDLFSDTQTRPTPGMYVSMTTAIVGDEQGGDDPTTLALCARVADMLGMEDAVLLPSGTMCNLVAVLVHTRPGDEVVAARGSHLIDMEGGGAAAVAGVSTFPLAADHGIFTAGDLRSTIRSPGRSAPRSALVVAEQTSFSAGSVWRVGDLRAIRDVAEEHGLRTHLDGARILNAVAATGVPAHRHVEGWDSAWVDLTKGLGCPVGAVLCGSRSFVEEAWRWKCRLGGAMRQSGVLAAAGLYALDHHVSRLEDDHDNAALIWRAMSADDRVTFDPPRPGSNMLRFSIRGHDASDFAARCADRGVRVRALNARETRITTHIDVSRAMAEEAARIIVAVLAEAGPGAVMP